MRVVHTFKELRLVLAGADPAVLVPTIGKLRPHELRRIEMAKAAGGPVVVCTLPSPNATSQEEPAAVLAWNRRHLLDTGCNVLFVPRSVPNVEPDAFVLRMPSQVAGVAAAFERTADIASFLTLTLELMLIARPRLMIVDKRDYLRLVALRLLIQHFGLSVRLVEAPVTRALDGYAPLDGCEDLDPVERTLAAQLYGVLSDVSRAIGSGGAFFDELAGEARATLSSLGLEAVRVFVRVQNDLGAAAHDRALVVMGCARFAHLRLHDSVEVGVPCNATVASGLSSRAVATQFPLISRHVGGSDRFHQGLRL